MRRHIALLVIIVTLSARVVDAQVAEQDSLALVAFFNATGGGTNWRQADPQSAGSWHSGPNWLTGPVSTWHSVTVTNNRVTRIYTELLFMKGELPPEIGNLSALTELFITHDGLTGSIPGEIGNLTNLESLGIYGHSLSGPIPAEIGQLKRLKRLILPFNLLSGSIPPEIGAMTSLEELLLHDNRLGGELPVELGALSNLRDLDVHSNPALWGELPLALMNLHNLRHLKVDNTAICAPSDPTFLSWLSDLGTSIANNCTVSVDEAEELPAEVTLLQNYPNPFSSRTVISYGLPKSEHVRLEVYDQMGRRILVLKDQLEAPGRYELTIDGKSLPSGTYFYTLRAGSFSDTNMMTILR